VDFSFVGKAKRKRRKHHPQKWVPSRAGSTGPGLSRASLRRALRLGFSILAAEPGSDGAIDLNKICQVLMFRRGHERKGLSHHEHAQIQNVLTSRDRQAVVVAHDGIDEHDPEPAIVQ
jgi:hypothetical protein